MVIVENTERLATGARELLESNQADILHIPSLVDTNLLPLLIMAAEPYPAKHSTELKDTYYEVVPGAMEMDEYVTKWAAEGNFQSIETRPTIIRRRDGGIGLHRDLQVECPLVLSIRTDTESQSRRFIAATGATAISKQFIDDHIRKGIPRGSYDPPKDEGILIVEQQPGDGILIANYPKRIWHMVQPNPSTSTSALIFAYRMKAPDS